MSEVVPRRRRRREEVLAVAARMFAEKGYEATTSQDIGEELGLLRGNIYYYFESKELLLFELIERVWAGALAYLEEVLAGEEDAVAKLAELLRRHVRYLTANTVGASLFLHETRSLSDEHRAIVTAHEARYRRAIVQLIRDGRRDGLIRADVDPRLAAFALLGAVNWTYRWYRPAQGLSAARVADQFASALLQGLLPR